MTENLMNKTIGELLSDPRIARIAPDAIRGRDLPHDPLWGKTLTEIRDEQLLTGDIAPGFERLYRAADSGEWYYPLDDEERGANLLWFPSDDPKADGRPFILVAAGGGFVSVWSMTEAWPVAARFNRLGYHAFILTYHVDERESLLRTDMEDFARALRFIRANRELFRVDGESYITCGFSAGGYLVCLWNTGLGYALHGLPKPKATFPIYPVATLRPTIRYSAGDLPTSMRLYGCPAEEAAKQDFEILDHADGFPPAAIFVAAEDELVNPENSIQLAAALEKLGIPCRLEVGPTGGHGFADGAGTCMAGWTDRAIGWFETL